MGSASVISAPSYALRANDLRQVVRAIENWLLHSDIQVMHGAQRGGIAGWLDGNGTPEFVYPEIAGYYLTAMAWLSTGEVSSPARAETARLRARRAVGWIGGLVSNGKAPPTRLYLRAPQADWRNAAVFSFDLAMAARGVAAIRDIVCTRTSRQSLQALCAMLGRISSGADVMVSHELVGGDTTTMPERWSTRAGPHHLKAAAAVLRLPDRVAGSALVSLAHRTCEHWTHALQTDDWPCAELHALLYGIEGMLIRSGGRDGDVLRAAERIFVELMGLQASDGCLPETIDGGIVRSDVIAQALRVGLLLRGREYLSHPMWTDRLDGLTDALLGFVRADGGVLFSRDQAKSNTWCGMFAQQALRLRARGGTGDAMPATAFELLV